MAPSAPTRSAKDKQDLQNNVVKQESTQNNNAKADNDSSSWNVVAVKRQHYSQPSKPTIGWGNSNRSKQQTQKPRAGHPQNNKQRSQKQKQHQHPQQHQRRTSGSNPNAKNHPNNVNNRKAQQTSTSNENGKKNAKPKPKPKAMTVGDMLPLSNKKKFNKDSTKKVSQPQPQPQHQHQHQQQQPKIKPQNLHTESVQDFPALGSSNFPALPQPSVSVASKKGWGAVPKPTPAPSSATFYSNNSVQNNKAATAVPEPTSSRSSPPSKAVKAESRAVPFPRITAQQQQQQQQQPTRVLKRGEAMREKGPASAISTKKRKEKSPANNNNQKPKSQAPSSAASFFQPKARDLPVSQLTGGREMDGEEHKLLRLVQERNVYQKRGRQRVAPRKKKFTALKKKVLQERLDQWRTLHPEEVPDSNGKSDNPLNHNIAQNGSQGPLITRSVCLYNYAEPEELEDDDEYEEILENLTSMATKIGPIDEVFLPRSSVQENNDVGDSDSPYRHPVFLLFQKESDASAALACWSDWLIGGKKLEVVGLEVQDESIDSSSPWSKRALEAESQRRNQPKVIISKGSRSMEILLQKVLTEDDYEDEDCMSESLADLKQIALRFGAVGNLQAAGTNGDVLVTYENSSLGEARGIAQELCRVVVGGQPLYASVCEPPADQPVSSPTSTSSTLLLENVLTEDDLQDSDCLQESLNDVKELCLRYGAVLNVVAKGSAVKVTYQDEEDNTIAQTAASKLNGIILGGNTVKASVLTTAYGDNNFMDYSIDIYNLITKDDMDDEECMEESVSDVEKLASNYGKVVKIDVCKAEGDASNDPTKAFVRIQFASDDPSIVAKALEGFSDMVIGGQIISASLSASGSAPPQSSETTNPGDKRKPTETPQFTADSEAAENMKKARIDDKEPLYSGDKLISERFATMKRVPKIPNKEGPREYASRTPTDERVKPLLTEMLGELMRLQKRAIEDKNAKARRRMVMGLREVARGIRAHKVKMVVMANNLDQYGVIDEKLQEIIDLAKSEGVPLFFEFTKRSLGKAIGKSIKIAVVGIQNADGAHQPFKKLNAIANRM